MSTAQQCGHLCQILCTLGVRTFLCFFSSSTSGFSSQMPVMPSIPLAIPKHRTHTRYIDPTVFIQDLRTHTSFSRSPMSPSRTCKLPLIVPAHSEPAGLSALQHVTFNRVRRKVSFICDCDVKQSRQSIASLSSFSLEAVSCNILVEQTAV